MKLFLETASVDEIRQALDWGVLDGVVIPAAQAARLARPLPELITEVCQLVDGPVTVEATSLTLEALVVEGRQMHELHPNVVVNVPVSKEGLKAIRRLYEEGIRSGATFIFQPMQALLAARAGAYFVCPIVERLNRLAGDGIEVVEQIKQICDQYFHDVQLLVAGVRSPLAALQAALVGAEACAMPLEVLAALHQHPLTDEGIDVLAKDLARGVK